MVRHAKAERRSTWERDDFDRPLTRGGVEQAAAIARTIAEAWPDAGPVLTSPYARCQQTAAPIAEHLAALLVADDRLSEGSAPRAVVEMIRSDSVPKVMVTHGDVLEGTIEYALGEGARLLGEPDWSKGCIWSIEVSGGRIVACRPHGRPRGA